MPDKENEGATTAQVTPSEKSFSSSNCNTGKSKKTRGLGRCRNFATVVYPESAPDGWVQKLDELHIAAFISPLHDRDIDADGKPKKPHWHVLVMFSSVKTLQQAQEVINEIGGVGCQATNSLRGYARYLIHADNPDKAQYNRVDVVSLGGADYDTITHLPTDDMKLIRDMMEYIRVNQIQYFSQFADICAQENDEWFRAIITKHAYFIKEYIKSLAYEDRDLKGGGLDTSR